MKRHKREGREETQERSVWRKEEIQDRSVERREDRGQKCVENSVEERYFTETSDLGDVGDGYDDGNYR